MGFSCEPKFEDTVVLMMSVMSRIISFFTVASYRFHEVDFTLEENVAQWLLMLQKIVL